MSETEGTKRSRKETAGLLKRFIAYYKPHKKLFAMDPIITRTMLNNLIPDRNYRMIVIFGVTLLALYFIKMLLNYFIQYQGHMMGVYMQARMRTDLFAHLETLPYSFFDNHETFVIIPALFHQYSPVPKRIFIFTISI